MRQYLFSFYLMKFVGFVHDNSSKIFLAFLHKIQAVMVISNHSARLLLESYYTNAKNIKAHLDKHIVGKLDSSEVNETRRKEKRDNSFIYLTISASAVAMLKHFGRTALWTDISTTFNATSSVKDGRKTPRTHLHIVVGLNQWRIVQPVQPLQSSLRCYRL